jgi:ankyrin repeat protein
MGARSIGANPAYSATRGAVMPAAPPDTVKPYFGDIVAGGPSQVVKDNYLIEAATYGDIARVRELLANGANANTFDNSPLRLAAANGHAETVQVLLEDGANGADPEALCEAAKSGYADIVELLVGCADPETRSRAIRLASGGSPQTPGAFGARRITPENGHARTIKTLQSL